MAEGQLLARSGLIQQLEKLHCLRDFRAMHVLSQISALILVAELQLKCALAESS